MYPHYRAPVLRALSESKRYKFQFWGSHDPIEGIECFAGDEFVEIRPLRTTRIGRGFLVSGIFVGLLQDDPKVVILLGNPNIPQTWLGAIMARVLGKTVLFWGHGWLKRESKPKALFRNLYFSLANGVLVYGDNARQLAADTGFRPDKIFSIYNSLDWRTASHHYEEIERRGVAVSSMPIGFNEVPLLICTARLTRLCRFDLLLDAMALLRSDGFETRLCLVGEGPERSALEKQAKTLALDVSFLGAIYDEQILAELLYSADATVSPGKIGLTAIHSLSYGTPVVTHSDLSDQMPEVEAIVEGTTGAYFAKGDVNDLARAIRKITQSEVPRGDTRKICRSMVSDRYTPERQRDLIEAAIDFVLKVKDNQ